MSTLGSTSVVTVSLHGTSEPRLNVLKFVFCCAPNDSDVHAACQIVRGYMGLNYEGRFVAHISFTGDIITMDTKAMMTIIGSLLNIDREINRVLKGMIVQPRTMDDSVIGLKNLFLRMCPTRKAFDVVVSDDDVKNFILRLEERERIKRNKR